MIWLSMLPFALYGTCGLATIPLCVIIAFLLLGACMCAHAWGAWWLSFGCLVGGGGGGGLGSMYAFEFPY